MALTCVCHCAAQANNKAVESAPPLKATANGSAGLKCFKESVAGKPAAIEAKSTGVGFGVVESAIALQPFITSFKQFFDFEVAELTPCIVQTALQMRRHEFGVSVRATHGLIDDFVNQPQRFESVRRDSQSVSRV